MIIINLKIFWNEKQNLIENKNNNLMDERSNLCPHLGIRHVYIPNSIFVHINKLFFFLNNSNEKQATGEDITDVRLKSDRY